MSLHLRDVTDADLPGLLSLRSRAFGPLGIGGDQWWESVAAETLGGRWLAVIDTDGDLVGAGRIRPYQQAWGGRHLPMGGVAGVYVEPSARGQGVATTLTRGLIGRMAELGDVVSCLFPTTAGLYRRSGYEVGGVQQRTTYAGPTLRALGRESAPTALASRPRVRRAGPDDAQQIHRMLRDDAARHARSGPMLPTVEQLGRWIERDEQITYVLPDGVVIYDHGAAALTVEHLVAEGPQAAAALWGLVGSGSSAAPTVHTYLDPRDPLTLALSALPATEVKQVPWMARVIDLGAAFAARGFPPLTDATTDLLVDDPEAPRNTGRWRLSVTGGTGSAARSDADPAPVAPAQPGQVERLQQTGRVGARGLSALWCGWSTSRVRQAGLLSGGSAEDDAALDAIFAATPYLTEYF
jgi:GNAT superfamily N-acetyltransferase